MRYVLTQPVPDGYEFFSITDTQLNLTVVTIFKDLPDAATTARVMLRWLNL